MNTNPKDWNGGTAPPQIKDPIWSAGHWHERADPHERTGTNATQSNLPLFDSVEAPQVGPTNGKVHSRGHLHPTSDLERAADLLLPHVTARKTKGRPRRTDSAVLALEERTCAVKDTAEPTDLCTCGHMRQSHANQHAPTAAKWCTLCDCDTFTKEPLTLYDDRAAANWEKNHGRTP